MKYTSKRSFFIVGFFGALVCARVPAGIDFSSPDFGIKAGVALGTIKLPEQDAFGYGGFLLNVAYHLDMSRVLTLTPEIGFVFDPSNSQISRTGFDLVVSYHLLGGSRHFYNNYPTVEFTANEPFDLSIAIRGGLQKYGASNGTTTAQGSDFELMLGVLYRQDISESSAITGEIFVPTFSLPMSVEKLTASQILILASWRFFL